MLTCTRHPGIPAVANCPVCHTPFCSECRVEKVGAERSYCSESCRGRDSEVAVVSDVELAEAAKTPIRSGWHLWIRSSPHLARHILPVAGTMAFLLVASGSSISALLDEKSCSTIPLAITGILWGLFGYGIALTGVLLSCAHTGHVVGNAYLWAARRLIPWLTGWIIVFAATILGLLLLIVPGIIVGIRLFFSDEFALVHSVGPLTACRQSWRITQGRGLSIFGFQFFLGLAEHLVLIPAVIVFFGIQLGVSAIGADSTVVSFLEALLVFWLLFTAYGSLHAPELVYFYGIRAERSAINKQSRTEYPVCEECGQSWDPRDYRPDAKHIFCSYCKAELRRPTA